MLPGVTVLLFFQGFGDPARLVVYQTGDSTTIQNIRKEFVLDQPVSKQFLFYLNDISPISIYSKEDFGSRQFEGVFIGGDTKLAFKMSYLRRSYQIKRKCHPFYGKLSPVRLYLHYLHCLSLRYRAFYLAYSLRQNKIPGWMLPLFLRAYRAFQRHHFLWALC